MDKWLQPEFRNLLENKKFCDCHIEVKKQTFECHKVILASASEFFERMFLSDFNESKSGKFVLNDVQPETFAHFLHYVYTYDTKALQKHATLTMIMELLVCGSSWLVESIVFDCVAIIKMKLPTMLIGDLVRVFQKAHDIEKEDLIICCKNQLHSRYRETMNCCETVFLTSEVFKQYLIITQDCLPEVERFKMMQTYLSVNGLIDNEAVEPTEHVYGDVGQVELPENSNDDDGPKEKERDDSESLDLKMLVSIPRKTMPKLHSREFDMERFRVWDKFLKNAAPAKCRNDSICDQRCRL
ncbi:uncharacterized protein Dere_GG13879 [Drosophila erecta]|uniref:BTB domain-containing protein n=1 Tax=Drosophila erecta TaxID=7220 RepID=B3NH20_DROER|nr:uncharacterized protein Dere_GG13879 [Drosophila erecta]